MAASTDLGEALENFITKLVALGCYHSKSEVLREGVLLETMSVVTTVPAMMLNLPLPTG
jgi:putative addiction module CopG family antidote